MDNILKTFLKINTKYQFQNYPNQILIIDRSRTFITILQSLFGIALCKIKKKNILVLSEKDTNRTISIFKSFGIKNFMFSKNFYLKLIFPFLFLKTLFITIYVCLKIKIYGFDWLIEKFSINQIKFGDLIYDSYARKDHGFLNLNLNFTFIKILFISILKFLNLYSLIKQYNFRYILVSTSVYATYSGIAARIAINKKIKVIEPYARQGSYLSYVIYDPAGRKFYTYDNTIYGNFHKKFLSSSKKMKIKKLDDFVDKRFKGKIKTLYTGLHDLKNANKEKFYISRSELIKRFNLNEKKIKKIVIIAPHAFSDTSHNDGKLIFTDYYQAFYETVKFVSTLRSKNILWLVKPHPSGHLYGEKGMAENVVKKYQNKYLKFCPKINTQNLIEISDHSVTCSGRIALEFACYGKKSLTSATNDLSRYNVYENCNSKNKYFAKLRNIMNIPKLNNSKKDLAKKLLYFLDTNPPERIIKPGNILIKYKSPPKTLTSLQTKTVLDNIIDIKMVNKLKKTNFFEDAYFKDLLNIVKEDKKLSI